MYNVGIIGLGEVAQLMHLPILHDMPEKFKVTSISDVAPSLVDFIAEKYQISEKYYDGMELIKKAEVDVIFILSPDQYHGEYIKLAMEKGKHVFVEKPVVLCSEELKEIIELKESCPDVTVMVGYMRRYSESFKKAKEILENDTRRTEYLRFRDIICEGPFYIAQTREVFYPPDVPKQIISSGIAKKREHLDRAIGKDATDDMRTSYTMMTGLGSHSLSAVRELFGMPKRVLSANSASNGEHLVIVFDYGEFIATYELVNNQNVVQFDAAIEIFQNNRKMMIKYETPYIRYQPNHLVVIESNPVETCTTIYGPDYRDPFKTELSEFYRCILERDIPKSNLEDSLNDLLLFEEIISALKAQAHRYGKMNEDKI